MFARNAKLPPLDASPLAAGIEADRIRQLDRIREKLEAGVEALAAPSAALGLLLGAVAFRGGLPPGRGEGGFPRLPHAPGFSE